RASGCRRIAAEPRRAKGYRRVFYRGRDFVYNRDPCDRLSVALVEKFQLYAVRALPFRFGGGAGDLVRLIRSHDFGKAAKLGRAVLRRDAAGRSTEINEEAQTAIAVIAGIFRLAYDPVGEAAISA